MNRPRSRLGSRLILLKPTDYVGGIREQLFKARLKGKMPNHFKRIVLSDEIGNKFLHFREVVIRKLAPAIKDARKAALLDKRSVACSSAYSLQPIRLKSYNILG